MKLSIVYKLSISTVLLVLTSVGIISGLFYIKSTELLVADALGDISLQVQDTGRSLQDIVKTQRDDVLFLASTPPIQGILRAQANGGFDKLGNTRYEQWIARLATIFISQLETKPYIMIRFIDKQGQELISVVRRGSQLIPLKDKQLQNKSHRTYFKNSRNDSAGDVYVSDINLNREFGKVSKPYQQVLRTSTPVFDAEQGEFSGIVIVTSEIGQKLTSIQRRVQNSLQSEIYITNDQGGYLLHPDNSKAYGFDLGKQYRIQEDFPHLAMLYLPNDKHMQLTSLPEDTDGQQVMNFTKIAFDPSRPERFIAVAISQSYGTIVAQQAKVFDEILIVSLLLALMGAGLAVLYAVRFTRPIKLMSQALDDYSHQRQLIIQLPTKQCDEIGVLAQSFDYMVKQVKDSQVRLNDLNENLEQQIVSRTLSLEKSEAEQRAILGAIADAIISIDRQGIITSFNPAAEEIFQYKSDEAIGQNFSLVFSKEEQQQVQLLYSDGLNSHGSGEFNNMRELKGKRKNGDLFPLEVNITSIQTGGNDEVVGVLRDITQRKQAEYALIKARDEAEKFSLAKSEFLSSMSHELRTPLNAILGFGQLMEMDDTLDAESKEGANEIVKAGNHLLKLINEVLDLAKVESGQVVLSMGSVDVLSAVEECLSLVVRLAEKRNIQIDFSCLEGTGVYADHTRFNQALLNLLSNAIKYNHEKGTVNVEVISKQDSVVIKVIDNGPGIPEKNLKDLFLPFNRLGFENSTIEGTGIGLTLTKRMVEMMGGTVGVNSIVGEGSSFWIELPKVRLPMSNEQSDEIDSSAVANKELLQQYAVLYIEDNPSNLNLVTHIMARHKNIELYTAHIPELGVDLALEHIPDLILLDINMPGMDGYEVLDALKSEVVLKNIPIVAVSANAKPSDIKKGLMAGFADYVTKPIDVVVFNKIINRFLGDREGLQK